MSTYRADTIVACATPVGRGAIAIVRWSGRDALAIARRVFLPRLPGPIEPWRMRLGTVVTSVEGRPIDEAMGVYFPAPHSFTGEDTFEVHSHGSPVVVEQVVASAIAAGARAAERGEFSRRAVLNGKMDLVQAEAVADLVDARIVGGAQAAWRQLQGALSREIASIRDEVIAALAGIEARVDFTDDELPEPDTGLLQASIAAVRGRIHGLLDGFVAARRQREGIRVVFSGRPNAGKSSLVNRLLGFGRMIVSPEPGTTRDVVEETVEIDGVAFVLADTAGIRETGSAAEAEAVTRAQGALAEADVRVLVVDASGPRDDGAILSWKQQAPGTALLVWNKVDLVAAGARGGLAARATALPVLECSALTGEGCEGLARALVEAGRSGGEAGPAAISRLRHRAALEKAAGMLEKAEEMAAREDGSELAAFELRAAAAALAEICWPLDNEEVLDRIFSEFCIGK